MVYFIRPWFISCQAMHPEPTISNVKRERIVVGKLNFLNWISIRFRKRNGKLLVILMIQELCSAYYYLF